MVDRSTGD